MEIFLVEDSSMLRMRLEALLAQVPHARIVGIASGAREAIEGILEKRPHLAIVDIRLAEGTGFDVLREVSARAPEVDVYMLSNFASAPYRRLAADLGAKDFFDKSNEFELVRDQVAQRALQTASITS